MQISSTKKNGEPLECYVSWMGRKKLFHEAKQTGGKSSFCSTHRDLKRLLKLITTPCATPHGLGRSSAKHLGMAFQQKKKRSHSNRKSSRWGIIYLGDSGPKWRISQGSLLQKMDCYKKKWMAGGYDRPFMGDPSIWGMDIHLKWLKTWCSICHRTEKHPGHVLWPGPAWNSTQQSIITFLWYKVEISLKKS